MQNDNIDFQHLKRMKVINPLFQHCSKAIPIHILDHNSVDISDFRKVISYLVIPETVEMDSRIFECKSLCPIFNCNGESFILVRGENLWDFYRAKKENDVILTEEQIWILVKQITEALIQLHSFGHYHTHLKQYAIYRQSPFSYQLIYHPHIQSMRQLSRTNELFYWYDFYLSPQQLKNDSLEGFKPTTKQIVFSLGLLLLNVMNPDDFNRTVYSKMNYEIDWAVVRSKIYGSKRKYSDRLIDLVQNCLKDSPDQRYGFKELLNDTISAINSNKTLNLQFRSRFDQLLSSTLHVSNIKTFHKMPDMTDSRKSTAKKSNSKSQSPKSPSNSSKEKIIPTTKSKQKQTKNSKHSPEIDKNMVKTFESPPKKWKVSPVPQKKSYSIAKPQPIIPKEKQVQKDNQNSRKKPSVEKTQKGPKSLQKKEDVINFERGTFGGQQSFQMSSFSSSKFKKEIKIQIQSNPSQSIKDRNENMYTFGSFGQPKFDNFQTQKMITFGEMKSEEILNPSNSMDSLDSEICILDSGRKKKREAQKQLQKEEKRISQAFREQPQYVITENIEQSQQQSKGYTFERLRQCAKILAQDTRLARIESSLQSQAQKITLDITDCLQPLQILQTLVSQSHGVYIQGNLYFGPFQHGRRNGFGLEIFPEDQYYLGNFKDDLFHGEGFYYWNKNQYFLGMFENGKRVFGHLFGPKLHYIGQFLNSKKMNGFGKAKFINGQEYIGEWTQGRRSGIGKLTQITKDYIIGYWQKGKRAGYGQYISSNYPQQGYSIKAFWKDSKIISDVIIEYDNQNVYEGGLNSDFLKHGKGLFIYKKGGYYKGTFYNDNATHGELVYRNGEKYIGSLKNMRRNGFGEYHYLDGTVRKGNWIEDIRKDKDLGLEDIREEKHLEPSGIN